MKHLKTILATIVGIAASLGACAKQSPEPSSAISEPCSCQAEEKKAEPAKGQEHRYSELDEEHMRVLYGPPPQYFDQDIEPPPPPPPEDIIMPLYGVPPSEPIYEDGKPIESRELEQKPVYKEPEQQPVYNEPLPEHRDDMMYALYGVPSSYEER
ncbi:MAG: hypothetical protein WC966_06570 [Bradymonadales bacterium]